MAIQDESGNTIVEGQHVALVYGDDQGGYLYEGTITHISNAGIITLHCDDGSTVMLNAQVVHEA